MCVVRNVITVGDRIADLVTDGALQCFFVHVRFGRETGKRRPNENCGPQRISESNTMNAQALQMMEPMRPTQEVRAMTEREERAEVLRNRTEKDEKEFQNYYATLETGGGQEAAQIMWQRGTPLEEVKYYMDF